ncbi:MAG: SAM-dependent chlorinase/fluorinase [candidate division WOR-3 bacterium]
MRAYRPITLLTDFGHDDPYVGVMKGVILGIMPQIPLVDLCHHSSAFDIEEAAFLLHLSYPYFPPETIHIVVVDPGVGGPRRPLLVTTERYYFIAPDNGVLSYVYEMGGFRRAFEITAAHYFLTPTSSSFHGRDIFAPVAAYLRKGIPPEAFGPEIQDVVKMPLSRPLWSRQERRLQGRVLHVDSFGNLITNISREDLDEFQSIIPREKIAIQLGSSKIQGIKEFFGQGEEGRLGAIIGSSGYLEIFVNRGNASFVSGVGKGGEVTLSPW